ncbi:MAG: HD domain-containing protein [Ruminococcus sp.]|nr:HD domain-containing protein [Ruminococcus sp.]
MSRAIGSRYTIESSPQVSKYHEAVKDVISSEEMQKLKKYSHHHCMTRYQHCVNVSYYSYLLCRKLGFNAEQAARAGLLHDLYEEMPKCSKEHLRNHPEIALENARKAFKLSKVEADVILKHMWPIRKGRPRYPESYVVMMTDKYVAFMEFCIYLKQTADMTIKKHM